MDETPKKGKGGIIKNTDFQINKQEFNKETILVRFSFNQLRYLLETITRLKTTANQYTPEVISKMVIGLRQSLKKHIANGILSEKELEEIMGDDTQSERFDKSFDNSTQPICDNKESNSITP